MAAYNRLALWLFNEASSGTAPTTIADATGNANTLTINYQTDKAAWTSSAYGNGLDFTHTAATAGAAIAQLTDVAGNGNIGAGLSGASELTFFLVTRVDNGAGTQDRIFHLGSSAGRGLFDVSINASEFFRIRFRGEDASGSVQAGSAEFNAQNTLGYAAYCIVVDTTQATASNRVRVWRTTDGTTVSQMTAGFTEVVQNATLSTMTSADHVSFGDLPAGGANFDGAIFYAEIGTGQADYTTEIVPRLRAIYAANDTDPAATGPAISSVSSMSPLRGSTLTLTVTNASTSGNSVTIGGVAATVTAESTTSLTVTVPDGLPYNTAQNVIVTNASAQSSSPFALTSIQPPAGNEAVTLIGTLASTGNRLESIPDLAAGNQVEYTDPLNIITVNTDASITIASGAAYPVTFNARVWDGTNWSGWVSQTIALAFAGRLVRALTRDMTRNIAQELAK